MQEKGEDKFERLWFQIGEFFTKELEYIQLTNYIVLYAMDIGGKEDKKSSQDKLSISELILPFTQEFNLSLELKHQEQLEPLFSKIENILEENKKLEKNKQPPREDILKVIARETKELFQNNVQAALDSIDLIVHKRIQGRDLVISSIAILTPVLKNHADFNNKTILSNATRSCMNYQLQLENVKKELPKLQSSQQIKQVDKLVKELETVIIKVDATLELSKQVKTPKAKLELLTTFFSGLNPLLVDYAALLNTIIEDLHREKNNPNFCQIPRVEPQIKYLMRVIEQIQENRNIQELIDIGNLVIEELEAVSEAKPIPPKSPQARTIRIIKVFQQSATQLLFHEALILGELNNLESYFNQPTIKEDHKKLGIYISLLQGMKEIIESKDKLETKKANLRKLIKSKKGEVASPLERMVGQHLFASFLTELEKKIKNADLNTLNLSIEFTLARRAPSQTPALASSEFRDDQSNEKEKGLLNAIMDFSENELANNPPAMELSSGIAEYLIRESTSEPDYTRFEWFYNKIKASHYLSDDLISAYLSVKASNPEHSLLPKLEELHELCFDNQSLEVLDYLKAYAANMDPSKLPRKENLLADLEYFFKKTQSRPPFEVGYYLSQIYFSVQYFSDMEPDQKKSLYTNLDKISNCLYGLTCSKFKDEFNKKRIDDAWVELNIAPAPAQKEINLKGVEERFLELFPSQSEIASSKSSKSPQSFNHQFIEVIKKLKTDYPLLKQEQPLSQIHYQEFAGLFFKYFEEQQRAHPGKSGGSLLFFKGKGEASSTNYPEKTARKNSGSLYRTYKGDEQPSNYSEKTVGKGPGSMVQPKGDNQFDPTFELAKFIFKDQIGQKDYENITNMRALLAAIPEKYRPAEGLEKDSDFSGNFPT